LTHLKDLAKTSPSMFYLSGYFQWFASYRRKRQYIVFCAPRRVDIVTFFWKRIMQDKKWLISLKFWVHILI